LRIGLRAQSQHLAKMLRPTFSWGCLPFCLPFVTSRHEMYVDEGQAWLIARDSGNLLELVQHLRYEGHPALWYLLIYLPAHLSANLCGCRLLNYVLSVAMAWLVLSERRIPLAMRVMSVFSVSVFFYMGVVARSYMLAAVLLVGAARCLLADRPRHWLAMGLLALAINAHVFAIPVAAGIFVWFYWLAPAQPARRFCRCKAEGAAILDIGRDSSAPPCWSATSRYARRPIYAPLSTSARA
jgi:hypothetical protein